MDPIKKKRKGKGSKKEREGLFKNMDPELFSGPTPSLSLENRKGDVVAKK
jgi:hypothetical protein